MKLYCTLHEGSPGDCRENADIAHACASERAVKASDLVVKRDKEFAVFGNYGVFLSGKRVATIFRDPADRMWYAWSHPDAYRANHEKCRSKAMHGSKYIGDNKAAAVESIAYKINQDQGCVDDWHWRRAARSQQIWLTKPSPETVAAGHDAWNATLQAAEDASRRSRNPIESSQLIRAAGVAVAGAAIGWFLAQPGVMRPALCQT